MDKSKEVFMGDYDIKIMNVPETEGFFSDYLMYNGSPIRIGEIEQSYPYYVFAVNRGENYKLLGILIIDRDDFIIYFKPLISYVRPVYDKVKVWKSIFEYAKKLLNLNDENNINVYIEGYRYEEIMILLSLNAGLEKFNPNELKILSDEYQRYMLIINFGFEHIENDDLYLFTEQLKEYCARHLMDEDDVEYKIERNLDGNFITKYAEIVDKLNSKALMRGEI